MSLYKYNSGNENSIRNLLNGCFWFSCFSDYNDPFEGRYGFKKDYQSNEESYKKIINCFKTQSNLSKIKKDYIANLEETGSYDKIVKFIFKQFGLILDGEMDANISKSGVCCFSKGNESAGLKQLMWSHYSDGLRGFCLVFEDDDDLVCQSLVDANELVDFYLLAVKYTDLFPIVDLELYAHHYLEIDHYESNFVSSAMDNVYLNYMISKSKEWEYENEFRLISDKNGVHYWPKKLLKKILIGEKMPLDNKRLIGCILKQKYPGVEIMEVATSNEGYNLIYKKKISIESMIEC